MFFLSRAFIIILNFIKRMHYSVSLPLLSSELESFSLIIVSGLVCWLDLFLQYMCWCWGGWQHFIVSAYNCLAETGSNSTKSGPLILTCKTIKSTLTEKSRLSVLILFTREKSIFFFIWNKETLYYFQ